MVCLQLQSHLIINYSSVDLTINPSKYGSCKGRNVFIHFMKLMIVISFLNNLNFLSDGVLTIAITSDNQLFISGSWDKSIKIWELKEKKCLHTIEKAHDSNFIPE